MNDPQSVQKEEWKDNKSKTPIKFIGYDVFVDTSLSTDEWELRQVKKKNEREIYLQNDPIGEVVFNQIVFVPKSELDRISASVREETLKEDMEVIREIRARYKCGACDGAKCEHTLFCKSFEEALSALQKLSD